ncbi:EAL and HDOD domain-containing protein [Pseudomonadota bacterium]
MPNLYLARQPIYDTGLKVYAYELLYRSAVENAAPGGLGDEATYTVLVNALTEIGLDTLVGNHYAFVNFTRAFIVGDSPLPFTGGNVVIEVLEDVKADPDVIDGIIRLKNEGYTIALDDFVYDDSLKRLVEHADIIKVDVTLSDDEQIREQVNTLRQFNVKLLAEKVETQEEYDRYKEMGFDYFQGYFFCRPNIVTRKRVPMSRITLMQLISKINDPQAEVVELEEIISGDVALSYKLFRYINSAFFSLPSKMESLSQVIVYMGLNVVKQWATVLALSNIDDKPSELLVTALVRAKTCEQLAVLEKRGQEGTFFIVGMFSLLDALLDIPMEEILQNLQLSDEVNQALLTHEGVYGKILTSVIAYEQGHWDEIICITPQVGQNAIQEAYVSAVPWAQQVVKGIGSD